MPSVQWVSDEYRGGRAEAAGGAVADQGVASPAAKIENHSPTVRARPKPSAKRTATAGRPATVDQGQRVAAETAKAAAAAAELARAVAVEVGDWAAGPGRVDRAELAADTTELARQTARVARLAGWRPGDRVAEQHGAVDQGVAEQHGPATVDQGAARVRTVSTAELAAMNGAYALVKVRSEAHHAAGRAVALAGTPGAAGAEVLSLAAELRTLAAEATYSAELADRDALAEEAALRALSGELAELADRAEAAATAVATLTGQLGRAVDVDQGVAEAARGVAELARGVAERERELAVRERELAVRERELAVRERETAVRAG